MKSSVYKIELPLENHVLGHVNSYIITHSRGAVLVDPGWAGDRAAARLEDALAERGFSLQDVTDILVTHGHADHCGLAGSLSDSFGIPVHMSGLERQHIRRRFEDVKPFAADNERWLRAVGAPDDVRSKTHSLVDDRSGRVAPLRDWREVSPGKVMLVGLGEDEPVVDAVASPGHTAGHLCFHVPSADALLTGDHIFAKLGANATSRPYSSANPLLDYLISLCEIQDLRVPHGLPGHGPAIDDLAARVDDLRATIRRRAHRVLTVLGDRPLTSFGVFMKVAAGYRGRRQGLSVLLNMLGEVDAVLQFLRGCAIVDRTSRDGTHQWVLAARERDTAEVCRTVLGPDVTFSRASSSTVAM